MWKILVIDDDDEFLELMQINHKHFCNKGGFSYFKNLQFSFRSDVGEATVELKEEMPHLILLDHHLPMISGLQFLSVLKRICAKVPIVLMSMDHNAELRTAAKESGATLFIRKPSDQSRILDLFELLYELLKEKASAVLEGNLAKTSLHDLIQLSAMNRGSSAIEIWTDTGIGKIIFLKGELSHVQFQNKEGAKALMELFRIKNADFRIVPYSDKSRVTITDNWKKVVMEIAKKLDEEKK